jgi:hypothetical protein
MAKPKVHTRSLTLHVAHLKAALSQYLRTYFPEFSSIEGIEFIDPGFGRDMTFEINFHFQTNKKDNNVKKDSSVYDTLPSDVEPTEGVGY